MNVPNQIRKTLQLQNPRWARVREGDLYLNQWAAIRLYRCMEYTDAAVLVEFIAEEWQLPVSEVADRLLAIHEVAPWIPAPEYDAVTGLE